MNKILDRLWLGNFEDAAAYATPASQAFPFDAVLTLCEAAPPVAAQLQHIHAPIPDEMWLPPAVWAELCHALGELLHHRASVLVHCRLGVSRSPALVAAYLARCGHSGDVEAALRFVTERRTVVRVHAETWRGVVEYWEALWKSGG